MNSFNGKMVIVPIIVDDSSIGHYESFRGKIIAERDISRGWRKKRVVRQYAVQVGEKIVWRDADAITIIKG